MGEECIIQLSYFKISQILFACMYTYVCVLVYILQGRRICKHMYRTTQTHTYALHTRIQSYTQTVGGIYSFAI